MFCNICKRELPESMFYPNNTKGGFYTGCKDCRNRYRQPVLKAEYKYFEPCQIPVIKEVVKKACGLFKINVKDFYSSCRVKEFAFARKWVCQQLKDTTDLSLNQIGQALHLDHTTVMYSCRQESRLAVAEYLQGGSPLIPIKRMNYQTGEITIEYIPEKKQKWIKIN